tara:strand:+ start:701 stop:1093 length:393 start_codon:yes stop_codon:yes gene_type:complete
MKQAHDISTSNRDRNRVAMEAFFNLVEKWQIDGVENKRKLLGQPPQSTFFKWQRGDVSNVPHDTIIRISYLMGIHKALKMLFSGNNERAYAWVKKPSIDLNGQSAYERMLAGEVTDLAYVRNYLDTMRGM